MYSKRPAYFYGPLFLALAMMAVLAVRLPAGAETMAVCNVPGDHSSIQNAVNDGSCDTINLTDPSYSEHVTINRTVTVQGQGAATTIVDGGLSGRVFTILSNEVTLSGMTIQHGRDTSGGIFNAGTLHLADCTVSGNEATDQGGGIWNDGGMDITNCTIKDNDAPFDGGGISNHGTLTIEGSTLDGNSAQWGGGITNWATLAVNSSTFSGNAADVWGGGIQNKGGAHLTVNHSTFKGNQAGSLGGGINNDPGGTVELFDSIIADSPWGWDCNGTITSQGYNIDTDDHCGLTNVGDQPNTDPWLGPLQDNGGPTWTHALLSGSPAIDAGSCSGVTADQRGLPQPVNLPHYTGDADDGCDIGALEVQDVSPCQVPADYGTIQDAVDEPGCGLVEVDSGPFPEHVTIRGPVTIEGQGAADTIVDGGASGDPVFDIQSGVVALISMTIQNGSADFGGGIHNEGTLDLIDSTVRSNHATDDGGAIWNHENGLVDIINCTIEDNTSGHDAGGIGNRGTMTVEDSTLDGNSGTRGGGISNWGTLTVNRSTLNGNHVTEYGGGIRNYKTLTVDHTTFSGNTAGGWAGAISNLPYADAWVSLSHSTISGNSAPYAGGIVNDPADGTHPGGTVQVFNSIIANNRQEGQDCYWPLTSLGYNIDSDNSCSLTEVTDHPDTDPRLGPLQDNGGPTWTHALQSGPAVDAGSCPGVTADQRGFPRPINLSHYTSDPGDGCDIGAYEAQIQTSCRVTADFDEIQDAVDDPGCALVEVESGTFPENVTIYGPVTVEGQGAVDTIVEPGPSGGRVFDIQSGIVTLISMTIQNGSASDDGGGIFNEGTLHLADCTLRNNHATRYGGGIWNDANGVMDVSNCTLIDNSSDWEGGGIANEGEMAVEHSTIHANTAGSGGGIVNSGTLNVRWSTLSGNHVTEYGGGIRNYGTVTVNQSTFSQNYADDYGGGISNLKSVNVNHSTFSGNSAVDEGGGIENVPGGTVQVFNSIIANSPIGHDCAGVIASQGYNIASDGSCDLYNTGDQNNTLPLLGPLQDNGGPTFTFAPQSFSPAIDAGHCPGITEDQRGFPRPVDGNGDGTVICDIGSVEVESSMRFRVYMPLVTKSMSDARKLDLLETYAPRLWLAEGEEYYPSSVEWAFDFVERRWENPNWWLITKESLPEPSDRLPFFYGCDGSHTETPCTLDDVPVYAFWHKAFGPYADLVYYFYYPYNRGKEVVYTIFGNHVSDWEHVTVRLMWQWDAIKRVGSWVPVQFYLSSHDAGETFAWAVVPKVEETHPIAYSAWGSHGCYIDAGEHIYGSAVGVNLTDWTSEGVAWDTWHNIEAFDFDRRTGLDGNSWPLWMRGDWDNPSLGGSDPASGPIYRWGNHEDGSVFGYYQLDNGPTGPIDKDLWNTEEID